MRSTFNQKTQPHLLSNEMNVLAGTQQEEFLGQRLKLAFQFLDINEKRFSNIHTQKLKINHLKYHLVLFEFSIKDADLQSLAETAFRVIKDSGVVAGHKDIYGQHSMGLWDLDMRSSFDAESEDPMSMSMEKSFLFVESKSSGVEPGFIGQLLEDAAVLFFDEFSDQEQRLEQMMMIQGDLNALMAHYNQALISYLVKLTYEVNESDEVVPAEEDLARTGAMKKIEEKFGKLGHTAAIQLYKKLKTRSVAEVNKEAILEVLANDVARSFGMTVQDQRLYLDRSSSTLRFLLKAAWVDNATLLQPLAGDAEHDRNYLVTPIVVPRGGGIEFLSNQRIPDLPLYYALLLVQADRDGIGSKGQNKLSRDGELIGIDFGHAYPEKNPLLDSLGFDFSFNAPEFKNYSIFSDASRSELMKGIFILARLAGVAVDEEIVKSYGAEFYQCWLAITPNADVKVFDDYLKKLVLMRQAAYEKRLSEGMGEAKANAEVSKEYDDIINTISETKKRHTDSRNAVLARFSDFMKIPADLVDSLQNIEKVIAATQGKVSMRSPDGKVMLCHIRMTENFVKDWVFGPHGENAYRVVAKFGSPEAAREALLNLQEYGFDIKNHPVFQTDGSLTFFFNHKQLAELNSDLSEEKIKQEFYPEDAELYQMLLHDEHVSEAVSKLSQYGLMASYKGNELTLTTDGSYNAYDASQFIRSGLQEMGFKAEMSVDGVTKVILDPSKQYDFQQFLLIFHHEYQNYQSEQAEFYHLLSQVNEEFGCQFKVHFELKYIDSEFKFAATISGDSLKIHFNISENTLFDLKGGFKRLSGCLRYETGAHRIRLNEEQRRKEQELLRQRLQQERLKRQAEEQRRREEEIKRQEQQQQAQREMMLEKQREEVAKQEMLRQQKICEKEEAFESSKIGLEKEVASLVAVLEQDNSWWNAASTLYNTSRFVDERVQLSIASVVRALLSSWLEQPDRHEPNEWGILRGRLELRRSHLQSKSSEVAQEELKLLDSVIAHLDTLSEQCAAISPEEKKEGDGFVFI